MSKEPNLAMLSILFGIILTIMAPSVGASPINSVHGKVSNNVHFEIFDCTVQGNSTHEISGPCPEVSAENPEINVDKSPETKVDTRPNNYLAEPKIMEDNFNKYDFNEIHLAEPEMEVDEDLETKVLVPALPDTSTSIDPFGPSG